MYLGFSMHLIFLDLEGTWGAIGYLHATRVVDERVRGGLTLQQRDKEMAEAQAEDAKRWRRHRPKMAENVSSLSFSVLGQNMMGDRETGVKNTMLHHGIVATRP
eukprot:TRINITY_DN8316_c0_g1_i1.p1 TRINITY_DN8316_c0_g1~~TRINITY_DN8316_c0_g1_i1.p1  ORF type:complete len:104 (+),score=4.73 TRINITY_DN8316_c0_g1_i1:243-554(+)